MVRLKDIAERAGVSVMTVSKVLRDATDISATTKARVRQIAHDMGYVPNSTAQSLRTRTTKLFGLIIPSASHPIFARVLTAIEQRCSEMGYDLILIQSLQSPEREENAIIRLLSRRVDGLLINPVYRLDPSAPIYDELRRRGTPTVLLGPRAPFCESFVNVESDDLSASAQLTRHLLDLGHRRIAFFTGPGGKPWVRERLEGYRRALRENGVEWDDRLVFLAGTTIEEGAQAARQFLEESSTATAIQACNDLVAIGAAEIFLEKGLRIPKDLSLTGFGNIWLSKYYRVPLTTARQPKTRLGLEAMEVLATTLSGEPQGSRRLPTELVIRKSTAPPKPC